MSWANQGLFRECIEIFQPPENDLLGMRGRRRREFGYVLFDFEEGIPLEMSDFTVEVARRIHPVSGYGAFVAPVRLPWWVEFPRSHCFTTALSAVLSFALNRPVYSPRDSLFIRGSLDEKEIREVATRFYVPLGGPGCPGLQLSRQTRSKVTDKTRFLIDLLMALPPKKYRQLFQAMRLVQLAHLNWRDDFALGYALLVAAAEVMATCEVRVKDVRPPHDGEAHWKRRAEEDDDFAELLAAYYELKNDRRYLSKRFALFLLKHCPLETWNDIDGPLDEMERAFGEDFPEAPRVSSRTWNEITPSDLTEENAVALLEQAYHHRSRFIHDGASPPHRDAMAISPWFEEQWVFDRPEKKAYKTILPTFGFMATLVNTSILAHVKG